MAKKYVHVTNFMFASIKENFQIRSNLNKFIKFEMKFFSILGQMNIVNWSSI